jgi:putative methanogenesis marker protein 12
MFIGVDHGTTAIRFATKHAYFEMPRPEAAQLNEETLFAELKTHLHIEKNSIKMFAVTYSMGDGINSITPIEKTINRGLITQTGAGLHVGGGTRVFDLIRSSGVPAVVIPGIHRGTGCDERLDVYSHGTSPEKIGIAYHIHRKGEHNFIVCDISSNTVTLAVAAGRVIGAIDACIFAPGIHHGPLDVEAIRAVDSHHCTANEAFTRAGVIKGTAYQNLAELTEAYQQGKPDAITAFNTLALLSSMEIAAMRVLMEDYSVPPEDCRIYLSGSISEMKRVKEQIEKHLHTPCTSVGRQSAAVGLAEIAEDIYHGATDILGIRVET